MIESHLWRFLSSLAYIPFQMWIQGSDWQQNPNRSHVQIYIRDQYIVLWERGFVAHYFWNNFNYTLNLMIKCIDPYDYHMPCSFKEPASRMAIHLAWQKLYRLDYTGKLFNQIFFIGAMFIGIIDFYHFRPLSLSWRWLEVTRSGQSKTYWNHFFPTLFNWSGWNLTWCWNNLNWTSRFWFWVIFDETSETTAVLLTALKKTSIGMFSDICILIWFTLGLMIDSTELLILVQLTLTLIQGHMSGRKQKILHHLSHKVFNQFGYNLVYCWDLLVWWNSYSFYFIHAIFKGTPTYLISLKRPLMVVCIQIFADQFVSNLVWWYRLQSCTCWH